MRRRRKRIGFEGEGLIEHRPAKKRRPRGQTRQSGRSGRRADPATFLRGLRAPKCPKRDAISARSQNSSVWTSSSLGVLSRPRRESGCCLVCCFCPGARKTDRRGQETREPGYAGKTQARHIFALLQRTSTVPTQTAHRSLIRRPQLRLFGRNVHQAPARIKIECLSLFGGPFC